MKPGDPAAFTKLVREHQGPLRSFLRRICRSFDDADDLAQETLITAWRQLDRFRGESTLRSWLCGIAYRKALASGRSRSRRTEREAAAGQNADLQERPQHDTRLDIERALASLTDGQQAVAALCWGSGFSQQEAADALDLPLGTVKSHINRARERLNALLED